jgi:hypothetical protein
MSDNECGIILTPSGLTIQNGTIVYYQDGWIKIDEVSDGVYTNRVSKYVGIINPEDLYDMIRREKSSYEKISS